MPAKKKAAAKAKTTARAAKARKADIDARRKSD
jgi:hypothetical protein